MSELLSEREKMLLDILHDIVDAMETDVERKDEIRDKIFKLQDLFRFERTGWK